MAEELVRRALFHSERFERLGDLDDLEKAIEYESRAATLIPDDDFNLTIILDNLGVSHTSRFLRLGDISDIEKAIQYGSRALALTPEDDPEISSLLANLGASYSYRFQRLNDLEDLEKSMELKRRAISLISYGHPALPAQLSNLAMAHRHRFERLRKSDDLEEAIEYGSQAVDMTPDDHPYFPRWLTILGGCFSIRFQYLGEVEDIGKAIEYETYAVALSPNDHPELPARLSNLGISHRTRFKRLHEIDDLNNAIEYQSRAVALTPEGHSDLYILLANLANSYDNRFERLGEQGDLEKVFTHLRRAISLIPDGHPSTPSHYHRLAELEFRQYQQTNDSSHLYHALDSFRKASQSTIGVPRDMFRCARHWATLASQHSALNPIEAYQTVINLLPQFIWLGATTTERYTDLMDTQTLAVDAAFIAISSSNNLLALEWLEHARCVVWNQSLMLRSPLDQLHSIDPDLSANLQRVATQLHQAGAESPEYRELASNSLTPEQVAQQHRRLAKEYSDLLAQARRLPGFEDFLQPVKANSLFRAARNGPIVIISCHKDRCDALVIVPGQTEVKHVLLPNFTGETARRAQSEIRKALRRMGVRERGVKVGQEPSRGDNSGSTPATACSNVVMPTAESFESSVKGARQRERGAELWSELEQKVEFSDILAGLWYDIVKPVLDFLEFTNNPSPANQPHLTWCPTGALSFLPLHAAGDYSKPRSRVFDFVISSYTPTLTAILPSTLNLSTVVPRLLAVGQADTPRLSRLPGTVKELGYVKDHAMGKLEYMQLINDKATTTSVLDKMEENSWVHLACHAHQNVEDPTKSGFFLHDGTLDLASINRRSFKDKGLAFLSACQTATGDERLPDEAIHLASGMLMAGYPSVIATMWSVDDDDAPFVADKVYGPLMRDRKIGNGEAGRALHDAVAELREKVGEKEFARWVPYIHIGS